MPANPETGGPATTPERQPYKGLIERGSPLALSHPRPSVCESEVVLWRNEGLRPSLSVELVSGGRRVKQRAVTALSVSLRRRLNCILAVWACALPASSAGFTQLRSPLGTH